MKTRYKVLIALVIVALTIASVYLIIENFPEREREEEITVSDIEAIMINPGDNYIEELEEIIETHENASVREAAILALADITIMKNETEQVVDFLKDIAMNEKEVNVRSAAYAALDLIREIYPLEKKGTLEVDIIGDIKKNGNIILVATISSTVDVEGSIAIEYLHLNIEPLTAPFKYVNLEADISQDVEFELHLEDVGEYFIPVILMLSFDRVDYEITKKKIFMNVYEDSGEVLRIEDL